MKTARKKIFVSYSVADKQFSHQLVADLRTGNLEIWEFSAGIQVGESIPKKISQALQQADHYMIILSPSSMSSSWVDKELDAAIDIETTAGRKGFIIPVLYKPCKRHPLISAKRYADFSKDYEVGFRELLSVLERRLEKTSKPRTEIKSASKAVGDKLRRASIVTLGGGNAEYLYELETEIISGEKNVVTEARELAGGGGMNCSARLIAAGFDTYPILAVGNDRSGTKIRDELMLYAEKARISKLLRDFLCSPEFFVRDLTTAFATLIVLAAKRTILNYGARGNPVIFQKHIHKRLRQMMELTAANPTVIHISHLPNLVSSKSADIEAGNEVIKDVLRAYGRKCVVSFNPGTSQIRHGIRYWETELKQVSLLQLNMSEAKQIFAIDGLSPSLVHMIQWFKEREISVVITLDRFGAVGNYKSGKDGIVFAWPIELPAIEVVDPTGAGDAFAAGVISEICGHPDFGFQDFLTAINTGRFWSAYACTTLGGASNCPDRSTLSKFRTEIERKGHIPVEVIHQENAVRDLRLINKAFE